MDELTLRAERIIWRGRALARHASGQVVIVEPGVFPGEVFKARVTQRKKDYLRASPVQIIEGSTSRRPHPCPHAPQCGGCRFGVLPNRVQLELKRELLERELARGLPREVRLPSCLPVKSPKAWRYRWRGQIHVRDGRPHFKGLQSSRDIHLEDCYLLAPPLARALKTLSRGLDDGRHTIAASPVDGQVAAGRSDPDLALPGTGLPGPFRVPGGSFFQANQTLNRHLVRTVTSLLEPYHSVADLYAGCGNFALPLAARGKHVLALDSDGSAVAAAKANALEMGLTSLDAALADLKKEPVSRRLDRLRPEAVIVDPPRAGGGRHITGLANLGWLSRIVWVSCDVVNSARDLKPFLQQGWEVTSLMLFDMFPQTWHMEAVAVLDRWN